MLLSTFKSLAALLSLGLVVAVPVTNSTTTALVLLNDSHDHEPANALVARDDCSTINKVVDKIGTSVEVAAYYSTGHYSSLWVCRRMNAKDCSIVARAMGSMFLSIAFIAGRTTGAYSNNKRDRDTDTLAGFLHGAFTDAGEDFDSIDDLTHPLQTRDTNGRPLEIASVKNWKYNGTSVNFDIHDFGGGKGHIILPFQGNGVIRSTSRNGNSSGTTVDKRDGKGRAPGFKVSYTTRKESKLTKAHRVDMANKLASDWASRANSNDKLSNYIYLWKTGHDANFYFRVIPESRDFNMNYETVDSCGGMARFL